MLVGTLRTWMRLRLGFPQNGHINADQYGEGQPIVRCFVRRFWVCWTIRLPLLG